MSEILNREDLQIVKDFPQLYKKTSTGAIQTWNIAVIFELSQYAILTVFGQLDGKRQESREVVSEGKNIGKANETTVRDQACLQSQSTWEKKLKSGYVQTIEEAKAGSVSDVIEGGIFPMLAQVYSKHGDKITFPALAQPKLDGHRCTSQYVDGKVTLWSRTRKQITSMPHICAAIENLYTKNPALITAMPILDGELYNHEYHDRFEELTSFIRQEEPKEGHEVVQYHVYDYAGSPMPNAVRHQILHTLAAEGIQETPIKLVESIVVDDEDELMGAFQRFRDQGYEGCMVRNAAGMYVNKRSYDLQKVKEFMDDEFEVVGVEVGTKGSMAGKAVFVCMTEKNDTFSAKMIGKLNDLVKYAEDPSLAIGKMVTVKYQGLTKYGIPRFPVVMRFREDV